MSEHVVRLSFPAKPDYLLLARLALSGIGRTTPVPEELLADLKLAITEACGNSVRHAYPEGPGEVSVSYVFDGDAIELIVEDQGVGVGCRRRCSRRGDGRQRHGHVDHPYRRRRARGTSGRGRARNRRPHDEAALGAERVAAACGQASSAARAACRDRGDREAPGRAR